MLRPLLTQWQIVDQPIFLTREYSLAIYALRLTGQDTVLLYSITGIGTDQFTGPGTTVQLKDNAGKVSDIIASGTLARHDSIEFGYLKFSPRPVDSKELILQVNQGTKPEDMLEIPVARLVNAPENSSAYQIRTYLLGTNKVFNQDNFRISFASWAAPSSVLSSIITPSAQIPAYPPPVDKNEADTLPTPTAIISGAINAATIKIEGEYDEALYLYVWFLTNGQITGELSK